MSPKERIQEQESNGTRSAPRVSQELANAATATGIGLRQAFGAELADPRVVDRVMRKIRLALSLKRGPGRGRSLEVKVALQMREQGKPWREIYPLAIAGYAAMDQAHRWHHEHRLRRNVRSVRGRDTKKAARIEALRSRTDRVREALCAELPSQN